ncbi:unnamed protein product [Paramecium pentaurelia]|uniref:BBS1 n=1 Tax=Paramecium pentaurelia TaxID=43138 RepID=A0A8S1V4Y8_9CILI|nr:unnamed protein product [Paramecium pentaurelia]
MKQGYWIQGWSDLVANLKVTQNCIDLVDVQGNGQYNLVVADQNQRLVSYRNTNIAWETRLTDKPVCMTYFYGDTSGQPCISICYGNTIYNYKIFKAFYKCQIPNIQLKQEESDIWKQYQSDRNMQNLIKDLSNLQQQHSNLSYKSLELLCFYDLQKQQELAEKYCDNLHIEDSITCVSVFKKNADEDKSQGQLIVGTELKFIYIYNQEITQIQKKYEIPGVPISICIFSEEQKDGRIAILVRENCIYFIGNDIEAYTIDLQSKPITMIRQQRCLYIATMDRVVQNYQHKQKQYQLLMQHNILAIETVTIGKGHETKGLLVALENKTIQFYKDTQLMSIINLESNVSVMKFGYFGVSQDGFLITINIKGALETRTLSREFERKKQAILEKEIIKPIEFPPITNLFIEQFQREREQGSEMLRTYQYDLLRMRYKTAQTYLNILSNNEQAPQLNQNNPLRLSAIVEGLGPKFKLCCVVENISNQPIKDIYINYVYNSDIYQPFQLINQLPFLIPKYQKNFDCYFTNIHQNGISDKIKIILYRESKQLIQTTIQMPMSELE